MATYRRRYKQGAYRPKKPFHTPLVLLIPSGEKVVQGVTQKAYPDVTEGIVFYGSFAPNGGTEKLVNDVIAVEDTAVIETWYRPDITPDCRIARMPGDAVYEIMGSPENMEERNLFLKFKVRRITGGA